MTLQEQLAAAKTAYHQLMTGQAVTKFRDQNGEEVTYTVANANKLATYINDLERKIDPAASFGAMRFAF